MTITGQTYAQMQDEVLGHRFNDTKFRPSVKNWLNEGQRYIVLQADLRSQFEAITIITPNSPNGLPDDFARLIEVNLVNDTNDWTPLYPMTLRHFDDAPVVYGTPSSYVVAGATLYLYPYPDSTVTVELNYYRLPADMTDDGDLSEIPVQYQHLLVRYALSRAYEREDDFSAAEYMRNQFEAGVQKLRGEAQYDTHDTPTQVGSDYYDGIALPTVRLP